MRSVSATFHLVSARGLESFLLSTLHLFFQVLVECAVTDFVASDRPHCFNLINNMASFGPNGGPVPSGDNGDYPGSETNMGGSNGEAKCTLWYVLVYCICYRLTNNTLSGWVNSRHGWMMRTSRTSSALSPIMRFRPRSFVTKLLGRSSFKNHVNSRS